MIFRIVYIGSTGCISELEAVAKRANPTARKTWLGVVSQDDCIEAEVESVEAGKALMKSIYRELKCFPKRYAYAEGNAFFSPDFRKYLGTEVCSDRYKYTEPKTVEHFEDFLED